MDGLAKADDLPPFVYPISSGTEPVDEPTRLDPEAQQELDQRIDELEEARGRAAVAARNYIVR